MRKKYLAIVLFSILAVTGCSSLMLTPVNFAWPLETALTVDDSGNITENRYAITINVEKLFLEETANLNKHIGATVHVIRNDKGYYFLTAEEFKNVYVFASDEGSLKLVSKIPVNTSGLKEPAFNQRMPNVELLSKEGQPILLTKDGIVGGKK